LSDSEKPPEGSGGDQPPKPGSVAQYLADLNTPSGVVAIWLTVAGLWKSGEVAVALVRFVFG
jgi:hypothetical protein